eukprot:GHVN01061049.1.p1 GENE.GHVN01061049.1~~GHVN01061049.1.p1  ORF type:complete len:190 (+),score=52.30 GHVN01061049.1:195-764(+)
MSSSSKSNFTKTGDAAFAKVEKVNSELLALTYGAMVTQLLKDLEHVEAVNGQLDMIGWNIGSRLVDEFFAKSGVGPCRDFKETAEVVAKIGFKMFLGVVADVRNWNTAGTSCSLTLADNPLTEFVELPAAMSNLAYSNLLCGVIRGALEQVHIKVKCYFVKDMLRGDEVNEIHLELKEILKETFVDDED